MMSKSVLVTLFAGLALASPAPQAATDAAAAAGKALYFLNNDPAGSTLAAIPMANDGTLSKPTYTSTGGVGLHGINATAPHAPLGPDSLIGQGAVAIGGNYLFTVNAGSHTLAMFKIDPAYPTKPSMVGKPVDTLGEFPSSVAYSDSLKTACVLNGGKKNGIACFSVSDAGLKALDTTARSLSPFLDTTTPPSGPPKTASQIAFSPNSKVLIADIKGDAMPNGAPGTFFVYAVANGKVARQATTTQIKDMTGNFGFAFTGSDADLFVTDVVYGGSQLSLGSDNKLTERTHTNTNTLGSCWATYIPATGEVVTGPPGSPAVAVVAEPSGRLARVIPLDKALMGAFDAVVDGTRNYFLAGSAAVVALDVKSGKTTQVLSIAGSGAPTRVNWQGLAMYPAPK